MSTYFELIPFTTISRMKSAFDQREWVKIAEEKLPTLRKEAASLQKKAASDFAQWESTSFTFKLRYPFVWVYIAEEYDAARRALQKVFYYETQVRVNQPASAE